MHASRSFRFSLFELAGILGIVAALAAVLVPVVAQARSTASSHAGSLHALSMAMSVYSQDYDSALEATAGPLPQCAVDGGNFVSTGGGCQDTVTGKVWSTDYADNNAGTHTGWSGAGSYCNSLVEGGQSDWRLPTENELIKVAADGAAAHLNVSDIGAFNWSSTTKGSKYAWLVRLDTGGAIALLKESQEEAVCVRP